MYQLCKLEDGLPLWMDTLCIPWEVAKRRARTKAIANINNIYLDATKVVVIADDLLALEYMRDCASGRIWLQFQMSSWMKRFWILQEGALQENGSSCASRTSWSIVVNSSAFGLLSVIFLRPLISSQVRPRYFATYGTMPREGKQAGLFLGSSMS